MESTKQLEQIFKISNLDELKPERKKKLNVMDLYHAIDGISDSIQVMNSRMDSLESQVARLSIRNTKSGSMAQEPRQKLPSFALDKPSRFSGNVPTAYSLWDDEARLKRLETDTLERKEWDAMLKKVREAKPVFTEFKGKGTWIFK